MLDSIFASTASISAGEVALCALISLALGLVIALTYMYRNTYTQHFVITLVLLPAVVQAVIMMVNGNLGTGIAVMGAFGLVRFRSAPGTAREIVSIFFAMAAGLATGMGYLAYAALLTAFMCATMAVLARVRFGAKSDGAKTLRIVVPEDVDYAHLFDDLFSEYAHSVSLDKVKTTNLGSLFELQYTIQLKTPDQEKAFLDQLRMRNGNLSLTLSRLISAGNEL